MRLKFCVFIELSNLSDDSLQTIVKYYDDVTYFFFFQPVDLVAFLICDLTN